jgi:hypothetical protein
VESSGASDNNRYAHFGVETAEIADDTTERKFAAKFKSTTGKYGSIYKYYNAYRRQAQSEGNDVSESSTGIVTKPMRAP